MSFDAMKQALEALEEVLHWYQYRDKNGNPMPVQYQTPEIKKSIEVITALRAAIEQAQEPVAWMTFNAVGDEDDIWYVNPDGKLLEGWTYKPLYTAPRQWQGLTDDEIALICGECAASTHQTDDLSYARAIEAKLKEKNT